MYETQTSDRAFLVGLKLPPRVGNLDVDASLDELAGLAETAGLEVVGRTYQQVVHPDPATYIRSGKVDEVQTWLRELEATTVIFDDELSPRHQRELEKVLGEDVRVLDRTTLILDIFAQHAHTKEGALQVELAQYEYRLPRLTRAWTHLARQAGGSAARGGVGLRGPGETQLETDRREIGRRISHLKGELEKVRAHRERYRQERQRQGIPVCALVGYTNAGKSTLLNRISGSTVYTADQLFATLDPTTRRVTLPGGQTVLFTDTVGFIQKLPHNVVAAFRATLEEVVEADLLVHVIDISHPFALEQAISVENTLRHDLGIEQLSMVPVFNKADRLDNTEPKGLNALIDHYPEGVLVSAVTGEGLPDLLTAIEAELMSSMVRVQVAIPYTQADMISLFYDLAHVEDEQADADSMHLTGLMRPRHAAIYDRFRQE